MIQLIPRLVLMAVGSSLVDLNVTVRRAFRKSNKEAVVFGLVGVSVRMPWLLLYWLVIVLGAPLPKASTSPAVKPLPIWTIALVSSLSSVSVRLMSAFRVMALAPSLLLRLEDAAPREINGALLTAWIVNVPIPLPVAAVLNPSELASSTLQLMLRLGYVPLTVMSVPVFTKRTVRSRS